MNYPLVSVVMPVRNEEAFIAQSLNAVLQQDYPADRLEVVIADGMSSDGTRQVIESLCRNRPQVQLIDNPGRIAPTALNAAAARCRGEVIVRVDGHCCIEKDYVRRCVEHLQQAEVDGVGGPIETLGQSPLSQVIAVAMSSRFGVGNSAFRTSTGRTMLVDTIAFPAYTRQIMQRAGGYDEELVRNQDDEYNYRLRKLGARLLLAPDVRSRYYSRASLRSLGRQYFQYGLWKVRVLQKHPRQMRARQFLPPVFVATLLSAALAAPFSRIALGGLAAVVGAYALASLLAAASAVRRLPWKWCLLLPVCFAILHVSYGLGFLAGLFRFRRRWRDMGDRDLVLRSVT